jgi:hypothetical protein
MPFTGKRREEGEQTMRFRAFVLASVLLCLALITGSNAVASPGRKGKPTITITSPTNGAVIHGSTVTVHVAVSHFRLVKPILLPPPKWKTIPLLKGNQGHIHYVLDSVANMVLGRDVVMITTHTWTNVAPGPHTITAYLATSQHAPFPGAKPATIHVTVAGSGTGGAAHRVAARPSIKVTGLQTQPTPGGATVVVHVAVSHFKLVPPVYKNPPLLPGNQGHIHYVLDTLANFQATRDAVSSLSHPWTHVSPGPHTVLVYLATSQHQHFPGTPVVKVHVNVPSPKRGGSSVLRVVNALPTTGGGEFAWAPLDLSLLFLGGVLALALGLAISCYAHFGIHR